MAVMTPGLSRGQKNRDLYQMGRYSDIEWIEVAWDDPVPGQVTIRLGMLYAEPAPAPVVNVPREVCDAFAALGQPVPQNVERAFTVRTPAPFFSTQEILEIAWAQLPEPDQFIGYDVFLDGPTPLPIMGILSGWVCRKARSFSVNVPGEGSFQEFWRRDPKRLEQLVPGDKVLLATDRRGVTWRVSAVSQAYNGEYSANLVEEGRGRQGQSIWVRTGVDVDGWA